MKAPIRSRCPLLVHAGSAWWALFRLLGVTLLVAPLMTVAKAPTDLQPNRYAERSEVPAEERKDKMWALKTTPHAVSGQGYLIYTNLSDDAYRLPLQRLANFRGGKLVTVADFSHLEESAQYIAIAPKSLDETTVLQSWKGLSSLDEDAEVDAFCSFLYAATADELAGLVERTIAYQPVKQPRICAIANKDGKRAYGKVELLHALFSDRFSSIVSGKEAPPSLPNQTFQLKAGRALAEIEDPDKVVQSDILLTFGHGGPKALCGYEIAAFETVDLTDMVVLSGSCHWGGNFSQQAIQSGAVAVYGHLKLNSGFPPLYSSLDSLLQGESIGQVQQQLVNALLQFGGPNIKDNQLLYVLIGDPALEPYGANARMSIR